MYFSGFPFVECIGLYSSCDSYVFDGVIVIICVGIKELLENYPARKVGKSLDQDRVHLFVSLFSLRKRV